MKNLAHFESQKGGSGHDVLITNSSRNQKSSSDFANDLRCDEHEIDLSAKESKNNIGGTYSEEGNDYNFADGDQRPTNPDSSDLSSRHSNVGSGKFKKDNQSDGFEKLQSSETVEQIMINNNKNLNLECMTNSLMSNTQNCQGQNPNQTNRSSEEKK